MVFPLTTWLAGYRAWLGQLIAMPSAVVRELALAAQVPAVGAQPRFTASVPWQTAGAGDTVMHGKLARLVAGLGMPAVYIASGLMFGGISLFFGYCIFLVWGVAGERRLEGRLGDPAGHPLWRLRDRPGPGHAGAARLDLERALAQRAPLTDLWAGRTMAHR